MTKDDLVNPIVKANVNLVFAFLSVKFPIVKLPFVEFVVKHYLAKWLAPMIGEGVVFVAFRVIDMEQVQKSGKFNEALEQFRQALANGVPDEKSNIAFDNTFRDAIRLRPN